VVTVILLILAQLLALAEKYHIGQMYWKGLKVPVKHQAAAM
jgi:hypothetical protein